jgi:hypothetical protein
LKVRAEVTTTIVAATCSVMVSLAGHTPEGAKVIDEGRMLGSLVLDSVAGSLFLPNASAPTPQREADIRKQMKRWVSDIDEAETGLADDEPRDRLTDDYRNPQARQ